MSWIYTFYSTFGIFPLLLIGVLVNMRLDMLHLSHETLDIMLIINHGV